MDGRIEARKKEFKKTFEDARRRREDQHVQFRRAQREEMLAKRLQQAADVTSSAAPTAATDDEAGMMTTTISPAMPPTGPITRPETFPPTEPSLANLPDYVRMLQSQDYHELLEGATSIRRLLSIDKTPPIEAVIDTGAVPLFVSLLSHFMDVVQFEAAWVLTNIASGLPSQTATVVNAGAIPLFVKLLSSAKSDVREQAAWALGNIAGDGPHYRDLVLGEGSLVPILRQLKLCLKGDTRPSTMMRNTCWTLSNLCRGRPKPDLKTIQLAIPVLRDLIRSEDSDVLSDACWGLSYVTDGTDTQASEAIELVVRTGIASRLVELLSYQSVSVQTPALRLVGNIVSGNEAQTQVMLDSGCVHALEGLLQCPRRLMRKEACWTVSNITAGTPSQVNAVIEAGLIPILVNLAHAADVDVKREASWALANAASGANDAGVHYLLDGGVMDVLVEILSDPEPKLGVVTLEALEHILMVGKAGGQSPQENRFVAVFEEAGGFRHLEQLQYLPEGDRLQQLAVKIMREYIPHEETF